jgi:hypothetical protein
MSDRQSRTPSPSHNQGSPTLGQQWGTSTRELIAQRELPAERIRFFEEMASFAERTGCAAVTEHTIDLWGYGDVQVSFADDHGKWWASLAALVEPTGVPFDELHDMYQEAVEDGDDDVEILSWVVTPGDGEDRDTCFLEMVGPGFAMRSMMSGPWGKEFANALMPTFRRALIGSGLGDKLGPVVQHTEDGTTEQTHATFSDFLLNGEGLPTRDEARERAFGGPAGAL